MIMLLSGVSWRLHHMCILPQKKKIKENFSKKPISYYGKTKLFAEQNFIKLKKRKIKVCIGRIFSTANNSQRANYLVPDLKGELKMQKKN